MIVLIIIIKTLYIHYIENVACYDYTEDELALIADIAIREHQNINSIPKTDAKNKFK